MGADIHMVLERRWTPSEDGVLNIHKTTRWVGVNPFPYAKATVWGPDNRIEGHVSWPVNQRNYALFAALGGVRGSGPAPKGVPMDASDLALMEIEAWGEDGHSHTWMLLPEALPLFVEHQQLGKAEEAVLAAFKHGTAAAIEGYADYFYPLHGDTQLDEYRLIMWFDN
jgi:hypothetical protein